VSRTDHAWVSVLTLVVLMSVSGEYRVPARLSEYIGQSPLAGVVGRDCAARAAPMRAIKTAANTRVMRPEYNHERLNSRDLRPGVGYLASRSSCHAGKHSDGYGLPPSREVSTDMR
jgi:hypothetical protein